MSFTALSDLLPPQHHLRRSLLLAAPLLAMAACSASGTAVSPVPPAASAASAEPIHVELEIMQRAAMSLAQAVAFAEGEVGGRVIEAGLDEDDDMYFYELELMRGDALVLVYMNPASGVMVGRRDPGLRLRDVRGSDLERAVQLAEAGVPVAEALAIAARATGGLPTEIEVDEDDGRWIYAVKTIQAGLEPEIEHEIEIDMHSGAILDMDEDD